MSEEVFEEARNHIGTDQDMIVCKKKSSNVDISSLSEPLSSLDQ